MTTAKAIPLQAIKANCFECSTSIPWTKRDTSKYLPKEQRHCEIERCDLHPFRKGKMPPKQPDTPKGPKALNAIKAYCYLCPTCEKWEGRSNTGKLPTDHEDCHITRCPLHHLRFGKNPNIKGGPGNIENIRDFMKKPKQATAEDRKVTLQDNQQDAAQCGLLSPF